YGPNAAGLVLLPRDFAPRTAATPARLRRGCAPPEAQSTCVPRPATGPQHKPEPNGAARCGPWVPTSPRENAGDDSQGFSGSAVSCWQCSTHRSDEQELLNLVL